MELWYSEKHTENVKFSIKVEQHLFSKQSEFQRIDVFESKEFGKFLTLDGLMMVTEKDEFIYHDMIVHVPMASNPSIKNVLVIGAGDGGTIRELLKYNTIEHIDLVEIDQEVVIVCKEFLPQTASLLDHPKVTSHYEDGLKFVRTKDSTYDLIIVDSTDPFGPGEGLFSREFYRHCYKALTPMGILINQHESPYYANYAKAMQRAHQRIKETFEIASVYQAHIPTYPSGHWLFGFASKGILPNDYMQIQQWNNLNIKTQYYNTPLHLGCFALPNYVLDLLKESYE